MTDLTAQPIGPLPVNALPVGTPLDPLILFVLVFSVTGLSGLAALLRSNKTLSRRNVISWSLNSGLVGIGLFWFWEKYFGPDNTWGLFGACVLVGLGGLTSVESITDLALKTVTTWAGATKGPSGDKKG